ncbi:hypothetical protein [Serratia ficaria]|uniref:hypothetical protein n=1 Tax=Serratia ficaria TaxID=61651 RepID=UPI0021BA683B|nr:hypothetical protein [Serratia ficaria]
MTIDKFWHFYRLVIGFGISTELWYVSHANGYKVFHLAHIGFTDLPSPKQDCMAKVFLLTVVWVTFRIGYVRRNNG